MVGKKSILDIIMHKNFEIIMFDRYNMYYDVFDNIIEDLGKRSVVLVETKRNMNNVDFFGCNIKFDKEGIYVYE